MKSPSEKGTEWMISFLSPSQVVLVWSWKQVPGVYKRSKKRRTQLSRVIFPVSELWAKRRNALIMVTRGKTAITKTGEQALMVQLSAVVRCLAFEGSNVNLTTAKLSKCEWKNIVSCDGQCWVVLEKLYVKTLLGKCVRSCMISGPLHHSVVLSAGMCALFWLGRHRRCICCNWKSAF